MVLPRKKLKLPVLSATNIFTEVMGRGVEIFYFGSVKSTSTVSLLRHPWQCIQYEEKVTNLGPTSLCQAAYRHVVSRGQMVGTCGIGQDLEIGIPVSLSSGIGSFK